MYNIPKLSLFPGAVSELWSGGGGEVMSVANRILLSPPRVGVNH
jgi:hypothetical protein